jgi:1-acyl-sn-glycerol-3-phosphate acyltransferase
MNDWIYKPAADLGLGVAERWRSLNREGGLLSTLAHRGWTFFIESYLRVFHRFEVEGLEHVPTSAPFIVVANHSSHLDALALGVALPRRLRDFAFPIAAGDTFFDTRASAALSAIFLNALPMWRKKCGPHAMESLRERLVAGDAIYLLFPEGTRARDGVMISFRAGIGMLVAGTNVPVVPAYLEGCFEAWPPGVRWPRPGPVRLRFGAPLSFPNTEDSREGWHETAEALYEAVAALAPSKVE